MLLALALICFIALIAAWVWLPASAEVEIEAAAEVSMVTTNLAEPEAA